MTAESLIRRRWSTPGDPRITPSGRWLRTTPYRRTAAAVERPARRHEPGRPAAGTPRVRPQLEQAIPHYRERLLVRPGVTGLAQVQLPPDTDLDSVPAPSSPMTSTTLHNFGFWFDVRLCAATVLKMSGIPFPGIRRAFVFPGPGKP